MVSVSGITVTPFITSRPGMSHPLQSGLVPRTVGAHTDAYDPSSQLPSVPHFDSFPFVPAGLSAKELARIHAETLHSQPAVTSSVLDESHENGSRSGRSLSPPPSPVATSKRSTTTSPPMFRVSQSQLDCLWREVQQLREERLVSEAPPSYAEREMY
jgi:hypothetical protein